MRSLALLVSAAVLLAVTVSGCAVFHAAAVLGQSFEDQKLIEVLAKYEGLNEKSIAVVVSVPLDVRFEHPDLAGTVTSAVTLRIGRDVPGALVVYPHNIVSWQWKNPDWDAMAFGELAEELNVERVVLVDIYEYRLNPPGNRWLWDGVCAGRIGVIEADGFDPDSFAEEFEVVTRFPDQDGVDRSQATASQIETGVLADFIKKTAWLFHKHIEPKHPDRYNPANADRDSRITAE